MPLVFRKVYGDVGGKRQVIRTEKISGDAAREFVAKRKAERAKSKEQRTFKNLIASLVAKKMEPVIEEKMQSASKDLNLNYIPNSITAATEKENNDLLIFKNRYEDEQTLIYVCKDNTCNVPTDKVSSAVTQCLE